MRIRQSVAACVCAALGAVAATIAVSLPPRNAVGSVTSSDGIVKVLSAYGHDETVERLRKDVESKGISFFMIVEQSKLAAAAGIKLAPSTLVVFGNPALGSLFITSNPWAGLDWPVRVLVHTDPQGRVWAAYTDFEWIAQRHKITTDLEPFKKASGVIALIMSSIAAPKAR